MISAVVVAKNEEKNLPGCLRSLKYFDQIIVLVDSSSQDKTELIAKKMADKVAFTTFEGFSSLKNTGIDLADNKWVLIVDADERITPQLAREIKKAVKNSPISTVAFSIPRLNQFLNHWVHHGAWWPDRNIRLFLKDKARYKDMMVHEELKVNGNVKELINPILHRPYSDLAAYFTKFQRYTILSAQQMKNDKKKVRNADIFFRPPFVFLKSFILKRGFLDGKVGLIIAWLSAFSVFFRYLKYDEIKQER